MFFIREPDTQSNSLIIGRKKEKKIMQNFIIKDSDKESIRLINKGRKILLKTLESKDAECMISDKIYVGATDNYDVVKIKNLEMIELEKILTSLLTKQDKTKIIIKKNKSDIKALIPLKIYKKLSESSYCKRLIYVLIFILTLSLLAYYFIY